MKEKLTALDRMLPQWMEYLIMVDVFVLVAVGALIWVFFVRKKIRWHRHKHRHHHSSRGEQLQKSVGEIKQLVEKRRRPRRRERRQINLTLAQTGGLPPIREPEQRSTRMPAPTPQP